MILLSNSVLVVFVFIPASFVATSFVLEIITYLFRAFTTALPLDIVQAGFTLPSASGTGACAGSFF